MGRWLFTGFGILVVDHVYFDVLPTWAMGFFLVCFAVAAHVRLAYVYRRELAVLWGVALVYCACLWLLFG